MIRNLWKLVGVAALGLLPLAGHASDNPLRLGAAFPTPADVCQRVTGGDLPKGDFIACPKRERGAISDRKQEGAEPYSDVGNWTILRLASTPTKAELAADYKGYTVIFFDRQHGTQVEYFGANNVSLWYPGNTVIVNGGWKLAEKPAGQSEICFKYQTTSYNPVTGKRGGSWECRKVSDNQAGIRHRIVGDPFELQSGQVPFIFERRKRMSLRALARQAGIDVTTLQDAGKP